jgi:hypothetical protein
MDATLRKTRLARSRTILAGILAGIAAPATIGAPADYPRPQGDDLSRIRGDVLRLGATFRAVIDDEQASRKAKAGA